MVQSFTAFLSLTGNSRTLSFWGTGATDRFRITSISLLTSCISFGLFCSMDIRSASISANFLKLNTLPLLPGCSPVARYSIRIDVRRLGHGGCQVQQLLVELEVLRGLLLQHVEPLLAEFLLDQGLELLRGVDVLCQGQDP